LDHQRALDAAPGWLRSLPFLVLMRAQLSLVLGFVISERLAQSTPALQLPGTDWALALADVFLRGVRKPRGSRGA
jgi:hypothetical protein